MTSLTCSKEAHAGIVIAGRYKLVEPLGKGGMGSVWCAEHLGLRSQVAVKLLDPTIAGSEEMRLRFMQEAQAAAALRGAHVVQIFDFGMENDVPYIVMELLRGESLGQRLSRQRRLASVDVVRIVSHVARAVGRAHESNIVHRDLKPDNIFIVQEDEEIAKVLDFGIAKVTGDPLASSSTRTGAMLGTPYYMSPEQAQGDRTVDYRSDLWAIAVLAYECMTGSRPFESDALGALVVKICTEPFALPSSIARVPAGFDEWCAVGLAKDPEQRFQSARHLAASLDALVSQRGTEPTLRHGYALPDSSRTDGGGSVPPSPRRVRGSGMSLATPASVVAQALCHGERILPPGVGVTISPRDHGGTSKPVVHDSSSTLSSQAEACLLESGGSSASGRVALAEPGREHPKAFGGATLLGGAGLPALGGIASTSSCDSESVVSCAKTAVSLAPEGQTSADDTPCQIDYHDTAASLAAYGASTNVAPNGKESGRRHLRLAVGGFLLCVVAISAGYVLSLGGEDLAPEPAPVGTTGGPPTSLKVRARSVRESPIEPRSAAVARIDDGSSPVIANERDAGPPETAPRGGESGPWTKGASSAAASQRRGASVVTPAVSGAAGVVPATAMSLPAEQAAGGPSPGGGEDDSRGAVPSAEELFGDRK